MNGLHEQVDQRPVLVIGIHREELGFGSMVANQLVSEDIDLIRIDKGLSHEKSWYRSGFYHSAAHREMYLQLHQQLKGRTHFVIDLHTGINEAGRCADILCNDIRMLRFMQEKLNAITSHPLSPPGEERLYQIIEPDTRPSKGERFFPSCHTIIPMSVWQGQEYTYVGLEIYLRETGDGTPDDWEYAARLIKMLCLFEKETTCDQRN